MLTSCWRQPREVMPAAQKDALHSSVQMNEWQTIYNSCISNSLQMTKNRNTLCLKVIITDRKTYTQK